MTRFPVKVGVTIVAILGAIATLGMGTAAAASDPYVGQTYAYVAGKVAQRGGIPVASTVVGDELSKDDCIVTSWHKAVYAKDNFHHDKDYLLALNCSAKLAHAGLPGNSLESPEGRAEKKLEVRASAYNKKPAQCEKNLKSCKSFCDKNVGMCSKEVMALLGG